MQTPGWALLIAFWLHMLATVVWIGGLSALSILVLPSARSTLEPEAYTDFLARLQRRLDPLGWLSLALLTVTGLVQMSANPNYEGFLAITNDWSRAILFKHILFFGMIGVSSYITWGLTPALRRSALKRARGLDAPEEGKLLRRENRLIYFNLLLGVLVLALTALARIS